MNAVTNARVELLTTTQWSEVQTYIAEWLRKKPQQCTIQITCQAAGVITVQLAEPKPTPIQIKAGLYDLGW
ncbi:MAG: hypothetical protein J0L66_07065 [Cytophagales bacterium]|nr:hypothetical protein [Cytophagales bacterium]